MEAKLRAIATGSATEGLQVRYSDVHGLWGGIAITLTGSGEIEAETHPRGGPVSIARRRVTAEQVAEVARLLVEIEAWEQRVPARMPVPDESRASLRVEWGGESASMWEWYNDLDANGRLVRVRDALLTLANPSTHDPP